MPEDSSKPLREKLGVRPNHRLRLLRVPAVVRADVGWSPRAGGPTRERVDFAMVFARSREQLTSDLPRLATSLTPAGALWVAWPKRGSGANTDLSDAAVRELGLGTGLVDVKVCSVTAEWSGLKFVRRVRDRREAGGDPSYLPGGGSTLGAEISGGLSPRSGARLMELVPSAISNRP